MTLTAKHDALIKLQAELQQSIINLSNEMDENEGTLTRIGRELAENKVLSVEHEQRAGVLQAWIERTKKQEQDYKENKK